MASGSMFGTDFSYEEFQRLQGLARDVRHARLPDGEVDGRAVWLVESQPAAESGAGRVVTHVDQKTCVPLRVEFEEAGRPRKVLSTDLASLEQRGSAWIARRFTMRDLREETETLLEVEGLELDKPIPESRFTTRTLETGARSD
jgi:hypothetical protein